MNKQHILAEIRRITVANNGTPPGIARFLQETGVRNTEIERLWVRWGDALREAGYAPNEMQAAYAEEALFEKLIFLSRELGRIPTYREMTMKARGDKTFPHGKTFGRLGSKQQLATKLSEYCAAREGYGDVAEMCEVTLKRQPTAVEDNEEAGNEREDDFGFVYLSKSGRYFKIGRSNSAGRREYEVALQMPEKYSTVHTIRTDDPVGIETYWHKRFEARRKNGEWFALSSKDVAAFKRRRFM